MSMRTQTDVVAQFKKTCLGTPTPTKSQVGTSRPWIQKFEEFICMFLENTFSKSKDQGRKQCHAEGLMKEYTK